MLQGVDGGGGSVGVVSGVGTTLLGSPTYSLLRQPTPHGWPITKQRASKVVSVYTLLQGGIFRVLSKDFNTKWVVYRVDMIELK